MDENKKSDSGFKSWLHGPFLPLYVVYFTASWGRRMWNFCLGFYLVILAREDVLLLSAIYGFGMGISILLLGGVIGWWIDKNSRIKVVRTTILLNKISVCICTTAICLILKYEEEIDSIDVLGCSLRKICQALVIAVAIMVDLANMAYKFIAVEKDWFVVVTAGDTSKLANLNAFTRSIDLISNIVAPILMGQIMTYGSRIIAGIVMTVWHFLAIFVEYALLRRVYFLVPSLSKKKMNVDDEKQQKELLNKEKICDTDMNTNGNTDVTDKLKVSEDEDESDTGKSCFELISDRILIPIRGLRVYFKQKVAFAGLSLAFLYFTVLGFDSITTGYIYANGISESIVGIALAISSLAGVIGAFFFTRMQKWIGLNRTGIFAYILDISCLTLCVLSIWAPGSPFDPHSLFGDKSLDNNLMVNCTSNINGTWSHSENVTNTPCIVQPMDDVLDVSIIMFLVGIICSRVGLWMVDLVVSQLIQQNVAEDERGIVNGVQNSLNMLMDMLKFIVVMVLPKLHTFGFLIILSYMFICLAGCLFDFYAFRASGYSVSRCARGKVKPEFEADETTSP